MTETAQRLVNVIRLGRLHRWAGPILLILALAVSAFASGGAVAATNQAVAAAVAAAAGESAPATLSPCSRQTDFDACPVCKSRACPGHRTLLGASQLDPVIPAPSPAPSAPRQPAMLPRPPTTDVAPGSFPAGFAARAPPSLG